ncbi:6058_t:CDS:2, partial [Gigaspora margarita]
LTSDMQAQRDLFINSSEIDILKQQIAELRKENDSLMDENAKIITEKTKLEAEKIKTDNFLDLESKKESYNTSSTMPTLLILSKVSSFDENNSSKVVLQSNSTNVPESLDSKTYNSESQLFREDSLDHIENHMTEISMMALCQNNTISTKNDSKNSITNLAQAGMTVLKKLPELLIKNESDIDTLILFLQQKFKMS